MTEQNKAGLSEGHYIVEMMGHQRLAGFVSECPIGGASLLRVDVPEVKYNERSYDYEKQEYTEKQITIPGFTKFVSPNSLYAITPCSEAACLSEAARFRVMPIAVAQLPVSENTTVKALPGPEDDDEDDDRSDDELGF